MITSEILSLKWPTQNCILAFLLLCCQITRCPSFLCVTTKTFSSILWLFSSFWILCSLHYALSLQNLLLANSIPVFLGLPSVMNFCITVATSAALLSATFSSWFINIKLSCEQAVVKFPGYSISCCFDASQKKDLTTLILLLMFAAMKKWHGEAVGQEDLVESFTTNKNGKIKY